MEKNNKIHPPAGGTQNKVIETYAEDMAKVLQDDTSGLIKKIIHEEEENEMEKRNRHPGFKKNTLLIVLSLLFISLSIAILFYFKLEKKVATVPIEAQFAPLVFNDVITFLEVMEFDKEKIIQTVYEAVSTTKVKEGGIEGIYLSRDKKVIGLREFISLIESSFVPTSNTLFVNDNFLIGVVNSKTNDFFILLKMRSIADIFDSLRTFEGKMFSDLHGFFGLSITPETEYLLTKEFKDGIVQNKNARILYDDHDQIVLMYIFANDNSIVITNTERAGAEVMSRLVSSQIKK